MDTYRCPHCQSNFNAEGEGVFKCPSCQHDIIVEKTVDIPWDNSRDWINAFYTTIKSSIVNPVPLFGAVARGTGLFRPWLYAVLISIIVFACAAAYQAGFAALQMGTEMATEIRNTLAPTALLSGPLMIIFFVLFAVIGMPIASTIGILIQAGLYHLCLLILGYARKDFATTFRTVCYSMGPQVFQVVPLFGSMVAGIWVVVLNIIGIKVVHETTYPRSAIVVFLPILLCCGAVIFLISAIAGGVFAAIMSK